MKPRNHVILAFIKSRKSQGAHKKSYKAERRQEKVKLNKEITKDEIY